MKSLKKILHSNKKITILFLSIFAISFLFPYSGDDWTWSLNTLSIKTIIGFSKDLSLNGRYFGNICAILLTKNMFIRGLIISLVLTFIIKIITKYEKANMNILILLLLFMPLEMLRQSIIWSSGFANYVISTLFLLLNIVISQRLYKNKNFNILSIFLMLISFLGSLIIENLSIFLIIYYLILIITFVIKNKKLNINILFGLIGSLIGTIIMFTQPVYANIFSGGDTYRNVALSTSIIRRIFGNYELVIKEFSIDKSILLWIFIILIMHKKYLNNNKKYNIKIQFLFYYEYLYIILTFIKLFIPNFLSSINVLIYIDIVLSLIFIFNILYLVYIIFKNEYDIFNNIMCIIGLLIPLLIVTPIGARNMFMIYVLEIILLIKIFNKSDLHIEFKYSSLLINFLISIMLIYYITVYSMITNIFNERYKYIKSMSNNGEKRIVVPYIPYDKYIWAPDFNDYRQYAVKKKLNVSEDIEFDFIDYKSWKQIVGEK